MYSNEKIKITINFNLLALLFIGLKLTNHIDWSWWWVLAPAWIPIGAYLLFLVVWFFVSVFCEKRRRW